MLLQVDDLKSTDLLYREGHVFEGGNIWQWHGQYVLIYITFYQEIEKCNLNLCNLLHVTTSDYGFTYTVTATAHTNSYRQLDRDHWLLMCLQCFILYWGYLILSSNPFKIYFLIYSCFKRLFNFLQYFVDPPGVTKSVELCERWTHWCNIMQNCGIYTVFTSVAFVNVIAKALVTNK